MIRFLTRALAVLSLLLGIGAATAWIWSYQRWDRWTSSDAHFFVLSMRGTLIVQWQRNLADLDSPSRVSRLDWNFLQYKSEWYSGQTPHARQIVLRYWFLTLLFVLNLPFWFLLFLRARNRTLARKRGLCARCGYDLRAHQTGDKCPECGTPVTHSNTDSFGWSAERR
jgi:hypothetical protein